MSALRTLVDAFLDERDRWPLWLPVLFGAGVAIYFALLFEPPSWLAAIVVPPAVAALCLRDRPAARLVAIAVAVVAAGFVSGQVRTWSVDAPMLIRPVGPTMVTGQVVDVDGDEGTARATIAVERVDRLSSEETPSRVRVRLLPRRPVPAVGDRIDLLARLMPPSPPSVPGGFDFQRYAFFQELGAVGFALGAPRVLAASDGGEWPAVAVGRLRQAVEARIAAALDDDPVRRGMAIALLTGKRQGIPDEVLDAMRDSGLAHLLAISGLHVGLVAGLLLLIVRGGLALVPPVALRYPIKKWAAVVALVGTFVYLLLSGATVPTQRAFVMIGIALAAVLFERMEISMRPVAIAALVVLAIAPESLMGPSFQMSFAAVVALVAVYEALRGRWQRFSGMRERRSGLAILATVPAVYLGGVLLTTIVANGATSPYAAAQFERIAAWGVASNMIAVPATALWVMPCGLLGLMLMPFGLEAVALRPMGWGIDVIVWSAREVSSWPGAVLPVPPPHAAALVLLSLGGLWLALWAGRWRLWGLFGIVVGLAGFALGPPPPSVLVSDDGSLAAVRDGDGRLWLSTVRRDAYTREAWMRWTGAAEAVGWPATVGGTEPAAGPIACDTLGCLHAGPDGQTVAFVRDLGALADDCRVATIVVAAEPVDRRTRARDCGGVPLVIDRFDLWRSGAHALWFASEGVVRVRTVRGERGVRPWTPREWRRQEPDGAEEGDSSEDD